MSLRIKAVVEKFVRELQEALDADIQDRIMKERRCRATSRKGSERSPRGRPPGRPSSRREAEIARQEARLKMERENLEKEKSVLTALHQIKITKMVLLRSPYNGMVPLRECSSGLAEFQLLRDGK
ncbi:hypothetical protein MUK42_13954 [Musa troglodytarum]|uniref:Uncharacterized protein n=1 Tax=Musa troglodytarum TaxID=320322 RepID=A0A9E7I5Z9_9LILI|nr:hypothetical protein MUK42_13954 [Musa troglodytarum]